MMLWAVGVMAGLWRAGWQALTWTNAIFWGPDQSERSDQAPTKTSSLQRWQGAHLYTASYHFIIIAIITTAIIRKGNENTIHPYLLDFYRCQSQVWVETQSSQLQHLFGTMSEKLCLRWNDFQENVNSAFGDLRGSGDFSDVTLACEDGQQIEAHRVILAASSPFFQNLLKINKQAYPIIYMKGMKSEDLISILLTSFTVVRQMSIKRILIISLPLLKIWSWKDWWDRKKIRKKWNRI